MRQPEERRLPGGMPYRLLRSGRRTMAIEISREGVVVVRAPRRATIRQIEGMVERHDRWIREKLGTVTTRRTEWPRVACCDGARVPFLGREVCLSVGFGPGGCPADRTGPVIGGGSLEENEALLRVWYRENAARVIGERVKAFAAAMGIEAPRVRITGASRRWGSYGVRGGLNFTWRLVTLPPELVDYVVVHELAHVRFQNHSRWFWGLVAAYLGDFRERRVLLQASEGALGFL